MRDYLVTWEIVIQAETKEAAAMECLEIIRDPNMLADHFIVQDANDPDDLPKSVWISLEEAK